MSDHDPRILKHVKTLTEVGTDVEKFVTALEAIRTDRNLSSVAKKAIMRTIAQDQAIAFLAAATGETPRPIKRADHPPTS